MMKLDKFQILGIFMMLIVGIFEYGNESNTIGFFLGMMMAVGLSLVLKWFPYKKKV
ncbi:hypothetical protein [Christiangramia sp. SM2212]|uniref:Uncharacterized protein n=1 Tax=Christiangramia sediminicola TaxID=3073267 RepID=A0ABU1EL27_9FLAO|nr:hypothetical protein [Christiangramia sp. SM2212]MDR5589084.1 hypothetical protein [Christiangramia sp. SM2212]